MTIKATATLSPEVVDRLKQYEAEFTVQLADIRQRFTSRMDTEAWGDPEKAAEIRIEWDAAIQKVLAEQLARVEGKEAP